MQYTITNSNGNETLSVIIDGRIHVVDSSNKLYKKIVKRVIKGKKVSHLLNLEHVINKKFSSVTDRVTVSKGYVYFDGDEVDWRIQQAILEALESEEENGDWAATPLVRFLDKLYQNPSENSRNQLFDWLERNGFEIQEDGDFLGYKAVNKGEQKGTFVSISEGSAISDDIQYEFTQIPQVVGSVVTMPRSEVEDNRDVSCSTGLHVGTLNYASSFGGDTPIIKVRVNPRDVVSVPLHENDKLRVCRYVVEELLSE